jgi:hypothetical protein
MIFQIHVCSVLQKLYHRNDIAVVTRNVHCGIAVAALRINIRAMLQQQRHRLVCMHCCMSNQAHV